MGYESFIIELNYDVHVLSNTPCYSSVHLSQRPMIQTAKKKLDWNRKHPLQELKGTHPINVVFLHKWLMPDVFSNRKAQEYHH